MEGRVYFILQIFKQGQWIDTPIVNSNRLVVDKESIGLKEGSYRIIERFLNEDILVGKRVYRKCC